MNRVDINFEMYFMTNKKTILKSMLFCFLLIGTLKVAKKQNVTALLGWRAAKEVGGSEGLQWAVSGTGSYVGSVAGVWAATQAGALLGTTVGPVGTFFGAAIGAGVGAY